MHLQQCRAANHSLSDIVTSLQEGDQLVPLNAFVVMDKNPQSTLDVDSWHWCFCSPFRSLSVASKVNNTSKKRSDRMSIEESYLRLGLKSTEALTGWYAFKGTDNTGSFAVRGVLSHFNALMQQLMMKFWKYLQDLCWSVQELLFLWSNGAVSVYYTRPETSMRTVLENLGAHYLHKNVFKEGQQLPPTRGTLVPHTSTAYYMAIVWKLSKAHCPEILSPTEYGLLLGVSRGSAQTSLLCRCSSPRGPARA